MRYITLFIFGLPILSLAQSQEIEVLEYVPAPGQFVNVLPEIEGGASVQEVLDLCAETLNDGGTVHLGTFGGYITVKFDHPVQNTPGSDLRIIGNATMTTSTAGAVEPGIVYVGVGQDVESAKWYELAGSEYYTTEIHDFNITYYRPESESGTAQQSYSQYDNYIRWEASWTENGEARDSTGYHMKNVFHDQSYWPSWMSDHDSLCFKGGKLPNNAVDVNGNGSYWLLYRYAEDSYGYVDAALGSSDYSTFDISWAVDSDGNPVELEEVNFIRVMCGIFQHCGWIGETSTEVGAFTDLHLVEGYDDDPIMLTTTGSISSPSIDYTNDSTIYNLLGIPVAHPTPGIYIQNGRKVRVMR